MKKIEYNGQSGWFLSDDQKEELDKVLKPLLTENGVNTYEIP